MYRFPFFSLPSLLLLSTLAGCADSAPNSSVDSEQSAEDGSGAPSSTAHAHPEEGPHQGDLIELGNEAYHAELVHDESSVTVYLLDGSATSPVAIESPKIVINLLHDGQPEQFQLAASPQADDPPGQASRFTLDDPELVGHLEQESAAPKLSVTIDGTPFQGAVEHDHESHDHEGHDHGTET